MARQDPAFARAMALIDAANGEDPNEVTAGGRRWPKELLYSERMSDMLDRYAPDADDAVKLAIRAQHVQRWKSPRDAYPMDRIGYLKWRKDLYKFHAETAGRLLAEAGCAEETIARVRDAVAKRRISENPDTQLLEDVTDLVFLEHYLQDFADKHPEYDEAKWIDIIGKTWKKMSARAHDFTLSGGITLPASLAPLVHQAVAGR